MALPYRLFVKVSVLALTVIGLPLCLWLASLWAIKPVLTITPFSWINIDGDRSSLASSQAPFTLLFLGYLSCDSICPATLAELATVARHRDPQLLQILFVTLDATHDTVERRRRFVDSLGIESVQLADKQLSRLRFELGDRAPDIANHRGNVYLLNRQGIIVDFFSSANLSWPALHDRLISQLDVQSLSSINPRSI
ncbi:SCO family protein [Gilvimarinus agarilyticus]|uniref:SCO family protein n=1 Tax=Gilvimarinus sp. 2_MG-2023 TaxID=3062666 RepID=UPI001C082022|nr:SCO family protein [Gilvimarinus sp. 2_MG-2023]MBU2887861.1 SCO family protein [Gilvimarinus agarilyticus]MDO6572499.1 SCO family protein [Gilvimarinus sp. 2_MG-2023]